MRPPPGGPLRADAIGSPQMQFGDRSAFCWPHRKRLEPPPLLSVRQQWCARRLARCRFSRRGQVRRYDSVFNRSASKTRLASFLGLPPQTPRRQWPGPRVAAVTLLEDSLRVTGQTRSPNQTREASKTRRRVFRSWRLDLLPHCGYVALSLTFSPPLYHDGPHAGAHRRLLRSSHVVDGGSGGLEDSAMSHQLSLADVSRLRSARSNAMEPAPKLAGTSINHVPLRTFDLDTSCRNTSRRGLEGRKNVSERGLRRGKDRAMLIREFRGNWSWLSNFYRCEVEVDGWVYPSSEHAFQACKTLIAKERAWVREAKNPAEAKRRGRRVTLRADWNEARVDVMRKVVRAKFVGNPRLGRRLVATGDAELVEGNYWGDVFWGVYKGRGENWLGRVLMEIRDELKGA